ncbi:MAG: hypothetical protein KAI81_09455 [Candidatus Marinimicrobia bacterium]|nr:hypothetical protein [Candidatus Neomarinimicrobiota bacterium]
MRKLIVYTGEWCSVCLALEKMLEHAGIQHEKIDLTGVDNYKELLYEKTGYWGTPGITLDGEALGGFPDVVNMMNRGELDDLKK